MMEEVINLLNDTKAKTERMTEKVEELTRKLEGIRVSVANITYALIQFKAALQLLIRDGLLDGEELDRKVKGLLEEAQLPKFQ